jgi:hypothetical protein
MKLHQYKQVKANLAGLTSPEQQAEMKLILAGGWQALKPLPVFKYETGEYRASIEFDKLRGEWVCHKTSFPSNKVQELRGGLTEITMALPYGQVQVFTEVVAAGQQEQELEKEAHRRHLALLEWRENYENGARYSELQDYLSESQQDEIQDSIRLTLTARQLQFNAKNVAYVFDALSKAGGRLATIMEIARRKKAGQDPGAQAQEEAAAHARNRIPNSIASEKPAPEMEGSTLAPVESFIPASLENFPAEPIGSVFPEHNQAFSQERIAPTAFHASEIGSREIPDASRLSLVEDFGEEVHHDTPVAGFGPLVRTGKVESSWDPIDGSPSRSYVLKISGFQVAAALLLLFALVSFTVGLTVGRVPLGKRLRDAQKSILGVDEAPPALPDRPDETTSRTTSVASERDESAPSEEKPNESTLDSAPFAKTLSTDSGPRVEARAPASPEAKPERNGSIGLIARSAPPPASPKPAHPPKAVTPISRATKNPAPHKLMPAAGAAPHPSPPSTMPPTILVTAPAQGGKPLRVTFQEKTIAASSSFAMTSQLSVLVYPEPGPELAHEPGRLQAGELVSFVWPRYPGPGDRYGSAETVKVRTTIGELGQVLDIKLVTGSISLLPSAISAVRLWHYKPTLLNNTPVQAQQDVTIEFRPPQYLSRVRTQHPSRN